METLATKAFCKIINNFYFAKCLRTAASVNTDAGEEAVWRINVVYLFILYLHLTCITTNVQFAKNKHDTSSSHKNCEAN